MNFAMFPFKSYSLLPDSTLANRIREETWDLESLFPRLEQAKSRLKKLSGKINPSDIAEIHKAITELGTEIASGFRDLKRINFYDSAIFYFYFKLLHHVLELCKREQARLDEDRQKAAIGFAELKDKEKIKKAKKEAEKSIRNHSRLIAGFDAAKKALVNDYEALVEELKRRRWDAEKQAQHEFTLMRLTWRGMQNINRKIKVAAIKVKTTIIPRKARLMSSIHGGDIKPEHIAELARLAADAIKLISKDVYYSSMLISKFEGEMESLKRQVNGIKQKIEQLAGDAHKQAAREKIFKPWDEMLNSIQKEVEEELMAVFRNIFVEHKHIAARWPSAA